MDASKHNFTERKQKTGERNHHHSRIFTKKYKDKRQKRGGGLHALLAKRKAEKKVQLDA